jgi:4-hydroxy-tetrahydrodipicolinate synthase
MHATETRNVIVPLVTPSRADDFLPLIHHVIEGGIQDLVLFGTTGEGEKIDIETKKSIIRNIVPFIDGRSRLYIGLMCSNITEALNLTNFCCEIGFEGALLPPHLYGDNPLQVVSSFLENSSSKFILYNPPGANQLGKIVHKFDSTRIVGLKDSSGDIALMKDLTALPRPLSCKIYYGREHLLDKALELNIDGIFPGTGNIQPRLLLQLWKHRDEHSFKLFNHLKDQIRTRCPENYIQGLKIELKNLGIISG